VARRRVPVLIAAAIGAVVGGLLFVGLVRDGTAERRPSVARSTGDPGLQRIRSLSREARGSLVSIKPGDLILSRAVGAQVWHLGYSNRDELVCWVLVVPHTSNEGVCGSHAQLHGQDVSLSGGYQPGRGVRVVYGRVSPRVRGLELRLAGCSELEVPLGSRPLFWRFLRPSERPIAFVASLQNGHTIRGGLAPESRGGRKPGC